MVSELGADGRYFKFPEKMKLALRLKDMLEEKVDEKYYLSDKIVSKLAFDKTAQVDEKSGVDLCDTKSEFRDISNTIKSRYDCGYEHFSPGPTGVVEPQLDILAKTENGNNFNSVYSENGISPTLLARDYKDPVRVAELKQVGQMYPNSGNPQAGRVYDKDGLSPCLDTCQGGNREVKIVENECSELQKEVCNRAVDYMQEGDVIDYTYSNSRLEEMDSGFIRTKNSEDNSIMNTLTTNAEAFGVAVNEPQIEYIGGIGDKDRIGDGKTLSRNVPSGNRVYSTDGLGVSLTANGGGLGGASGLYVEPQCVQYNVDTIVKVRKYPVDIEKLQDTLRERKEILKLNNDIIAEKLNVPITNVEHWFRKDKYFSIPTPEIWYKLKELLQIETDEFDESITTFKEKLSEFDMSNRAYDDNGLSPTITTQGNPNIVETDNLKRQLCNKLIEENKVQEGDIIRHSYTNSRFDSFHIENEENHDCCATLTTRPDCIGYVENQEQKPCPTLDTRCDCLGVVVNDSMYTETEKQLFTEDGNIKRYLNSDIVDKFEEGQMATTSYPNGYGHGSRTHNESISLNTIDKPSVKQNLRIRKLTPKECFRLMGVKDKDFEKIAQNQSNASLYHLAGDSIVVAVLMSIFGKLLNVNYREKVKDLLKDINPNFDWSSVEPEIIHEKVNLFDGLFD